MTGGCGAPPDTAGGGSDLVQSDRSRVGDLADDRRSRFATVVEQDNAGSRLQPCVSQTSSARGRTDVPSFIACEPTPADPARLLTCRGRAASRANHPYPAWSQSA